MRATAPALAEVKERAMASCSWSGRTVGVLQLQVLSST